MKLLGLYLREHVKSFLLFLYFIVLCAVYFLLFHLSLQVLGFILLTFLPAAGIVFMVNFTRFYKKHNYLLQLSRQPLPAYLPDTQSCIEKDYRNIITSLTEKQKELVMENSRRYADMMDYYTVWIHQIKTPIASMHLTLQGKDDALCRELRGDLQKIEQYVEMVLCYLRLDSDSTDYVLKEYELDSIVRQAVKRMASQFIGKKIQLSYEPLCLQALTDEKWLLFVIEQILSNALKYTKKGQITISMEPPETLCISDTGIGIAPEDLPRIFEKGFTGFNGHEDKKASGLGLYLCKRICQNLGHKITVESVVDQGTTVRIYLEHTKIGME